RRVAFAVTSMSGPPGARSSTLIVLQSLLALDTKLPGGRCLTHIGREGGANRPRRFDDDTQTQRTEPRSDPGTRAVAADRASVGATACSTRPASPGRAPRAAARG